MILLITGYEMDENEDFLYVGEQFTAKTLLESASKYSWVWKSLISLDVASEKEGFTPFHIAA